MIDIKPALKSIESAASDRELEDLRVKFLGRRGLVTEELRLVGKLPAGERAKAGQAANAARIKLESALAERRTSLQSARVERESDEQSLDLTAPVAVSAYGHLHPTSLVTQELIQLFWQMGYQVAEGPEVETEWYNFEALLVGADHPARDMQDTFYLDKANLPRTHTSSVQIRYMETHQPPIRIIAPGKVYRNEDEGPRNAWMFHQLEGLVVDKGVSVSDLKGTLITMLEGIFGAGTKLRLRPNFFPYTEPSVEMDAQCVNCGGKGCHTCSGTGWLELGGAGMVHPQVLRNVGIDPAVYSGFAFGFGPERLAMIKYGVSDIREFWRPNLNFLGQF